MKRTTFRARLAELGYRSYGEYLQSQHWADLRRRFFASKLFTGKCAACGSRGGLQVHHRTYKRLGHEWLHDVVALCSNCHSLVHRTERPGLDLWKATKRTINAGRRSGGGRHTSPVAEGRER